jgi:hypothetical protein
MNPSPPVTRHPAGASSAPRNAPQNTGRGSALSTNGIPFDRTPAAATEIDALVRKGLLGPETRNDPIEIAGAIYKLFEETLT